MDTKIEKPSTRSAKRSSSRRLFKERPFLFRMLAIIFIVEAAFLGLGLIKCKTLKACPQLGDRSQQLFGVAIATTLSLLTNKER